MLKFIYILIIFNIFSLIGIAQTGRIKGFLQDAVTKKAVAGATVIIWLQNDSSRREVKSTITDSAGNFKIDAIAADKFYIVITSVGYQKLQRPILITNDLTDIGVLFFTKKGTDLEEVIIIAKEPAVVMKGDTTQFSASQYKVNPDATTEDLIKKMPSITVAKDGTVTAQGETVKKVTVDGKDFFGDDASAALKNLPSEVVDKIQVYDRLSDQAQLTGFDDGNSVKAINIVTKSGVKNGQFGRVFAGYGSNNRYTAGGNMSLFNGNRRISFVGNFNNINQQNFGSQDLLGLTSSGGRNSGGRGGGGGSSSGNTNNFTVGQSPGISTTNAFGINYSNQAGKKVTIAGSYFFNNSSNTNESLISTETFSTPKNLFSFQKTNTLTSNTNHRFNLRVEYKIDSNNSIFITPSVNIQNNNSNIVSALQNFYGRADTLNTSAYNNNNNRQGFNIRNNIMFRHAFAKKGRSISVGLNTANTKNDGTSITNAFYKFFNADVITDSVQQQSAVNATNGYTIGGSLNYTEPLGEKAQLQFNYNPSVQNNKADQQTYAYDGQKYNLFTPALSNKFNNTITTNNAGLNYRFSKSKDEQFTVGVNLQNSKLESNRIYPSISTVSQSFQNILPSLLWRKKFSVYSNIRLSYRASVNFPSVNQLQDVVNLSDPLRVSVGNPLLKQSYTNLLSGRYSYTNTKTSRSFFANIFLQTAQNYISNAVYIAQKDTIIQQGIKLNKGSQLTKPVNLNGYKSLSTFFTYSIPLKIIKTVININAGFAYSKLPGMVNYKLNNTNNYVYNTGVVFASNISEYVDFNLSYNASFNNATTTTGNSLNSNFVNQTAGLQMNLLNKKGWFVNNDITDQSYSGLTGGFNQSFWLWNAAIGKKFLAKRAGELKLSVFDLLKQNQSIIRTVTGAYIEDARTQVLQQYFLLTFTYSLRNFGVAAKTTNGNYKNREGMDGPGGSSRPGGGSGGGFNPSF